MEGFHDVSANLDNAGLCRAEFRGCDRETQNCGGWWVSDFDTWEQCPVCFQGQQHPEVAYEEAAAREAWEALSPEEQARREAKQKADDAAREEEWRQAEARGEEWMPF